MSAVISSCGKYRYRLDRAFNTPGPTIAFMLHNPSTADAENEDPTSRRGIGFAKKFGAGRMVFVNPFAGRATKPADLWTMEDPIGPENAKHLLAVASEIYHSGGFFIFAWGAVNPPKHLKAAVGTHLEVVEDLIRGVGCEIQCLGRTMAGQPRHPLYLSNDAILLPWVRPNHKLL